LKEDHSRIISAKFGWDWPSPLKLESQSQPNFAEMILGWSPFKNVSVSAVLYLRWPPMLKIETFKWSTGHNFGRGPSKDHSTKVWLQLAQWFLRRRFLCEFLIRSYVKLSSAVGAILIEGPNRRTHIWKRTIQWLFHQIKKKSSPLKLLSQSQPNFAEMILRWSSSKFVSGISEHRPRWPPQPNLI
jgi:hypothetical protein